jgi:hypothetical protein
VTLSLPVLDDRRFADLVEEAKSLIPAYQPEWTDYNPSDPGITLIELFAWLAEMLIYRADQIPERQTRSFLKLLDPNAIDSGDLQADVTAAVRALREEYRAVTTADFEDHVLAIAGVARARCVPLRDLSHGAEQDRLAPEPAYVSVIIVPQSPGADLATLTAAVQADLEPRRLITTRVVVAGPIWTPIAAHVLVAQPADVPPADVRTAVDAACSSLLDPLTGGAAGTGWPFGRSVYVAELTAAIESLPQVDHLVDLDITSACASGATRCVDGTPAIADDGLLIGVGLGQDALPELARPVDVVSSTQFVPVTAHVAVEISSTVTEAGRAKVFAGVIRSVRDLVWPGRGWQAGAGSSGTLDTGQITGAATVVAGVARVLSVTLDADPNLLQTAANGIVTITVDASQLIEMTVEVTVGE